MIIKNRASTEFYLGKNFINKTEGKAQLKLTSTAQQPTSPFCPSLHVPQE